MAARQMYLVLISPEKLASVLQLGVQLYPVCGTTFTMLATTEQAEKMVFLRLIDDLAPHPFPMGAFKRNYEYLGDLPVGVPVKMDLTLMNGTESDKYRIEGELPDSFSFSNGMLEGTPTEPTGILNFTVVVDSAKETISKKYFVRFYKGQNRSRTFVANDYIQVGFGRDLVDYDPSQVYYRLLPNSLPQTNTTPFEYAKAAAKQIYASAGSRPVTLMVSGGIDSQCMLQSFLAAKVPFKAVFMRDSSGLNSLDNHFVTSFAKKHGVDLQIIGVDFLAYLKSYAYVPMAYKYRFNNPEYGLLLSLMDHFPNSFPVYAGRPISLSTGTKGERVLGLCGDETWSKARYLERNGREGAVEFLIHTPELMASFLKLKTALNFPSGQQWSYLEKVELLKEGGFDVSLAPPIKGTGFEDLMLHFPETPFGNEMWTLHRGPLKSLFPNPSHRNAILIKDGNIADDGLRLLRTYEDGFSYEYVVKNDVRMFH